MEKESKKRIVIVLGMHRSGTSAVTHGLQVLGVDLGDRLMPPIMNNNEKGFYEDIDIHQFNIELLDALESHWNTLSVIPASAFTQKKLNSFKLRAIQLLRTKLEGKQLFGFKDPVMGRLLPFWKAVFSALNVMPCYVIAIRHPLSVANSLQKRDGLDNQKSYYLWLTHVIPSILETTNTQRVVVDFDTLMREPNKQLERMAKGLGLVSELNAQAIDEYSRNFLDKRLQHTQFNEGDLYADFTIPPDVVITYDLLKKLAADEIEIGSSASHIFNEVNNRLLMILPTLGSMTRISKKPSECEAQVIELNAKLSYVSSQLEVEQLDKKSHQETITILKAQFEAEQTHNKDHQENIARFEETVTALKMQLAAEQTHNKDHQDNIARFEWRTEKLEETITTLKAQLSAERVHNNNFQKEISEWQLLGSTLDNSLFDLTLQLHGEQEEKAVLQGQIEQLQTQNLKLQTDVEAVCADKAHLELVLQRVHNKLSYRVVRGLKDMPANIKQTLLKKKQQELILEPKENTPVTLNVHDYTAWLATYGSLSEQQVQAIHSEIATWDNAPKIAVLMPVYNPEQACLENAIQSVLNQYYPHFELCIADDASTKAYVQEVLHTVVQSDNRVTIISRENNGHISAASNSALSLVTADYVALMDHDDLLTPDALYRVAQQIIQHPEVMLIYSDEDKMDVQGQRYAPYFKPDWNPELFLSHNFVCHLGVYKTAKLRELGGFNSAFDGAQDYDLALRYSETIDAQTIIHIPRILYHWRAVAGSTAKGVQEKPYAEAKIAKAVQAHLQRQGRLAQVTAHPCLPGALRVQYVLPEHLPLVSLVIPTRNGFHLLYRCVESIFSKTDYANYELIIIDNGSDDIVTLRYLQFLEKNQRVTVIRDNSPFNYSALNNKAVAQAKGELIALLNNDLEVINADWLGEMVSYAIHPEVGAVGAKLYYPNDTLQHAGVIVGLGGVAGHSHKHFPRDNPGFCGRLLLSQNLSAVTAACLVLRKEVFDAVGGLDEKNLSIAFNDVDFCLRIQEQGYYNVWTPYAELYHYESASRGYEDTPEKQARFNKEVEYMQQRWGKLGLLNDAAYNINLTLDREDFSFAWPPR